MKLNGIKILVKRACLLLQKHAPEIMCVLGTTSVLVGTTLACKSTLKVEDTLNKLEDKKYDLEREKEKTIEEFGEYDEKEYKRRLSKAYLETVWDFTKLYAPAAICIGGGLALLNGSTIVMKRRNAGLAAAYAVLRESYEAYRKKVEGLPGGAELNELDRSNYTEDQLKMNEQGEQPKPGDVKTFWFMYDALNTDDYSEAFGANLAILDAKEKALNKMLRHSEQKLLTINEIMDYLNFRYSRFVDGDHWCVVYDPSAEATVADQLDLGFHDNYAFTHGYEYATELKITCVYKPEGMAQLIEA